MTPDLEAAVDGLGSRLDELYEELSEREQAMLRHLLYRAVDPLTRAALTHADLIGDDEEGVLRRLEGGS